MKFVIDKAIPFVQGIFEPYARVVYRESGNITHEDLTDADALIIRTRTRCDESLLAGTSVKIIATATIGTDHIDIPWCESHGIFIKNAAGCNAGGVMNYVISGLYGIASRKSMSLAGSTIGIIGAGNVGSRVQRAALNLGFKVLLCDTPRAEAEGPSQFCDLDYLLENSDIVTLHVPLNRNTRGMADADFFSKLRAGAFFINCSGGALVDDDALKAAIPNLGPVIIDTWNHEPDIDRELLDMVDIATPHIAGYSYQGKQIGTSDVVRSVARFFGIKDLFEFYPPTHVRELEAVKLDPRDKTQGELASMFQYNYPIFTDDFMFRMHPEMFESLRENYHYRREFYIDI